MVYIKKTPEQRANDALSKLKTKRVDHFKSLKYKKLIALVAKTIVKHNDIQIENKYYSEILRTLYNRDDKLIRVRVKRMLMSDIAQKDLNNELMRILSDAGLGKDKLKEIYGNSLLFATEKKDVTNLLKIAEIIRVANNLVSNEHVNSPKQQFNTQINYSELRQDSPDTDSNEITQTKESDSTTENSENEQETQST